MVDFICMGLLDLFETPIENYEMKNSCPQWDSNPGSSAYEANALTIAHKHWKNVFILLFVLEQDKSSDIEQQPPFGDRKISNIQPQNRGGLQNQQEHHIILTEYEAVHPTAVSENNSSSGMLII